MPRSLASCSTSDILRLSCSTSLANSSSFCLRSWRVRQKSVYGPRKILYVCYQYKPLILACALPLFWLLTWSFVAPRKLEQRPRPDVNQYKTWSPVQIFTKMLRHSYTIKFFWGTVNTKNSPTRSAAAWTAFSSSRGRIATSVARPYIRLCKFVVRRWLAC